MSQVEENRWTAAPDQFAAKIHLSDLAGFFSKKLVIDPGTRALIVDDDLSLGEVPPGTYTLESFTQRLKPWGKKQATAVIVRSEEFPVDLAAKAATQENLVVDILLRITVQVDDVALFLKNLLGARPGMSAEELKGVLAPLVRQALGEVVGQVSINDLAGAQARAFVDAGLAQALAVALRRYGLRFGQVQTLSIRHERYDEHRRKIGEVWLYRQELEQQGKLDELHLEDELRKIRLQERTNELELLAQQIGLDRDEGVVAQRIRRIGIHNRLREAILSARFDEIKNEEDLARMIQEQDKAKLLRKNEMDELVAVYREKQEDRESARRFLVQRLDVERAAEMERLRADLDHQLKLQRLAHEIELAERVQTEENRRWRAALAQEREKAEAQAAMRAAEIDQQLALGAKVSGQRREEEWQEVLHRQRLGRIQGEEEEARSARRQRVEMIEAEIRVARRREEEEFRKRQREEEEEFRKRQAEFQMGMAGKTREMQMQTLRDLDEMDARRKQREVEWKRTEQELRERDKRLESEMALLRQDKANQYELERMRILAGMGTEALIVAGPAATSEQLVRLKMHEASEATRQKTAEALAQQRAGEAEAVAREREKAAREREEAQAAQMKMVQQLSESQERKAAEMAQVLRDVMASQQQMAQGAFQAMTQMGSGGQPPVVHVVPAGAAPVVPVAPVVPAAPAPPAAPAQPAGHRVLVCPQCRAENKETARFCDSCGTKL